MAIVTIVIDTGHDRAIRPKDRPIGSTEYFRLISVILRVYCFSPSVQDPGCSVRDPQFPSSAGGNGRCSSWQALFEL